MDQFDFIVLAVKTLVILVLIIQVVPVMIYLERKIAALIQDRPGPNRVGPLGLLQPVADALKLLMKEDPVPSNVNKFLFQIAPFLAVMPACLSLAALPLGDFFEIGDRKYLLQIADLNVGLLYIFAIGSLGIYGTLFGGWASNNKFSLIGAMRSASQIVSYEIPLALGVTGAVMMYGTLSLREMVFKQSGLLLGVLPNWGVFYQPLGFLVFFVAAFAETNRLPFDLPETEAELVAGFHTEYGSMSFASFFMAEYMAMTTMSAVMTTVYFGGWQIPYLSDEALFSMIGSRNILALIQVAVFFTKVMVFMCIYVWVRWTLPRFRFDQLMKLSWGNLIPIGLINIVLTAIGLYFWDKR